MSQSMRVTGINVSSGRFLVTQLRALGLFAASRLVLAAHSRPRAKECAPGPQIARGLTAGPDCVRLRMPLSRPCDLRIGTIAILDCFISTTQSAAIYLTESRDERQRTGMQNMKYTMSMALMLAATLGVSKASAETISGSAALALAGVVAAASPVLSAERKAVDELFAGSSDISYKKKIAVTADKIVCRAGNVDITSRSCELTFGKKTKTINGRAANELYSTEAMAGVPSDGAAGKIFESVTKLSCTLDPQAIKQKDGSGADCSYEMPK
jgi:hypothetical protein